MFTNENAINVKRIIQIFHLHFPLVQYESF